MRPRFVSMTSVDLQQGHVTSISDLSLAIFLFLAAPHFSYFAWGPTYLEQNVAKLPNAPRFVSASGVDSPPIIPAEKISSPRAACRPAASGVDADPSPACGG